MKNPTVIKIPFYIVYGKQIKLLYFWVWGVVISKVKLNCAIKLKYGYIIEKIEIFVSTPPINILYTYQYVNQQNGIIFQLIWMLGLFGLKILLLKAMKINVHIR